LGFSTFKVFEKSPFSVLKTVLKLYSEISALIPCEKH